jgi:hypothetical protein
MPASTLRLGILCSGSEITGLDVASGSVLVSESDSVSESELSKGARFSFLSADVGLDPYGGKF